jgi:hypothetical protein
VLPKSLALSLLLSSWAVAQVQLQFASAVVSEAFTIDHYAASVQLANQDTLLVGSFGFSQPGVYEPPIQRAQMAFAYVGNVGFPNGVPPGILPVLGGSANDQTQAVAVDPSGNIWVVGSTDSDDFTLLNPIISKKVPYRTAGFVIELDPTGSQLLFATFLAGQQPNNCAGCGYSTEASAIAIDAAGNVYVGGFTNEADFPTTPGAFMKPTSFIGSDPFGDSAYYSFLLEISPAGKLVYSTLLVTGSSGCGGGSACIGHGSTNATVSGIAVDADGIATVAGIEGGSENLGSGYVARMSADGSEMLWSAAPGGSFGAVSALTMAQDANTNVYLLGQYIVPIEEPDGLPPLAGPSGLFAAKLSSTGSVVYTTDLGQSPDSAAIGVVVDLAGNAYLAGTSSSPEFPALPNVPNLGADFILRLDESGASAQTLFRLPHGVIGMPPILNSAGELILANSFGAVLTLPPDYAFDTPAIVAVVNSASYVTSVAFQAGTLVTLFGFNLGNSRQSVQFGCNTGPQATLLYAGPNQINLQTPFESQKSPCDQILVTVPAGSITLNINQANIEPVLGLFTTDGVHAAALNQDGTVNSAANPRSPVPSSVCLGPAPIGLRFSKTARSPLRRCHWTRPTTSSKSSIRMGCRVSFCTRERRREFSMEFFKSTYNSRYTKVRP